MNAFLLAHRFLVDHVDDVDAVQAVDHANLAAELHAARGVRFDPKRRHQRTRFLDGDAGRAGRLGLFDAGAQHVIVTVQPDARAGVAQFRVDPGLPQAGNRAGDRVQPHGERRRGERRAGSLRLARRSRLAGGDGVASAGQRGHVLRQQRQLARRKPLRGNRLVVGIDDHVAGGTQRLVEHHQIGPRPSRRVPNVHGGGGRSVLPLAERRGQQLVRLGVGIQREGLLDLPLILDKRQVGLARCCCRRPRCVRRRGSRCARLR